MDEEQRERREQLIEAFALQAFEKEMEDADVALRIEVRLRMGRLEIGNIGRMHYTAEPGTNTADMIVEVATASVNVAKAAIQDAIDQAIELGTLMKENDEDVPGEDRGDPESG